MFGFLLLGFALLLVVPPLIGYTLGVFARTTWVTRLSMTGLMLAGVALTLGCSRYMALYDVTLSQEDPRLWLWGLEWVIAVPLLWLAGFSGVVISSTPDLSVAGRLWVSLCHLVGVTYVVVLGVLFTGYDTVGKEYGIWGAGIAAGLLGVSFVALWGEAALTPTVELEYDDEAWA